MSPETPFTFDSRTGALQELGAIVGTDAVVVDAPLAPLTTFRTGGRADCLVEPRTAEALVAVLRWAHEHRVPVTMLGGGSNVLVGDRGIRGLVVRPRHGVILAISSEAVRADAAVTINGLVRWLISRGLAGLEAWAGTPGTVGGGVYGNAHFQGRLLSERMIAARLVSMAGDLLDVAVADMRFGYDRSRLQDGREVLLSAVFRVEPGEPDQLRQVARESLAFRKRTQPLHLASAGCVFQNPGPEVQLPDGMPRSAGALVDRAGLKGVAVGAARVSTVHANFIVNEGGATAAEIRQLIRRCQADVAARFGVPLVEEIVYLGEFE